jgi:hypothetical protein
MHTSKSRFVGLIGPLAGAALLALPACAVETSAPPPPNEHKGAVESALGSLAAASCGARFVDVLGDDQRAGLPNDCTDSASACRTIQRGIDAACVGDTLHVAAGDYVENVVVSKGVTIEGAGHRTIVHPAVSNPDPCVADSLCGGAASSIFLVQASNVTFRRLTLDGDNPALTSGIVRGGADVDARNGIITNHALGRFDDLHVRHVTVRNVFLRGLYASSGGSFRFEDDVVKNVQGDAHAVAVFDFGGAGLVARTEVEDANDAISANHSAGVVFADNVVRRSGSGLHTDNAGDSAGASADRIEGNVVHDCTAGGYGVFVFVPYASVVVRGNVVRGCDVGLGAFGGVGIAGVAARFEDNEVVGHGTDTSVGVWVTTDQIGFGSGNVAARFDGNDVSYFGVGFLVQQQTGFFADAALTCNRVRRNGVGVRTASAAGRLDDNAITANGTGVDATPLTSGTLDARDNYWGCAGGPPGAQCDTALGPVDTSGADRAAPRCTR